MRVRATVAQTPGEPGKAARDEPDGIMRRPSRCAAIGQALICGQSKKAPVTNPVSAPDGQSAKIRLQRPDLERERGGRDRQFACGQPDRLVAGGVPDCAEAR